MNGDITLLVEIGQFILLFFITMYLKIITDGDAE